MSQQVETMFADIAQRYDVTNTVLSFGVHHIWRNRVVKRSGVEPGQAVLDCAAGTGDLSIAFAKRMKNQGRVVASDFCAPMLEQGRGKAAKQAVDIEFIVADAQKLPCPDNQFDVASIAFGIRNVDDPVACLAEMARVVKPGGSVMVLEFGQPSGLFGALYKGYSRWVIPSIGGLLTGNRDAYQYLPSTVASFPAGPAFVDLLEKANAFSVTEATPLTGGIAYMYWAQVA